MARNYQMINCISRRSSLHLHAVESFEENRTQELLSPSAIGFITGVHLAVHGDNAFVA